MAWRKPTHSASMMYDEKDQNGEMKTRFHEICPIWENDNGSMFINIPKGMLISGKIIISRKKESTNNGSDEAAWVPDIPVDDLPFNMAN